MFHEQSTRQFLLAARRQGGDRCAAVSEIVLPAISSVHFCGHAVGVRAGDGGPRANQTAATEHAFDNGMSAREPVPGTVARGQLRLDEPFFTGKATAIYVADIPERALARPDDARIAHAGTRRFGVYCSHCHGQVGGGSGGPPDYEKLVGMVVHARFPVAAHVSSTATARQMPLGHFST